MFRAIHTTIWTDPRIKALSVEGKLLFVYLITNPHAHISGIYYLPENLIVHELGLKGPSIRRLLDTLSKGYLVVSDRVSEVIWVRNMLRYQGKGEKIIGAVASQLASLHRCIIIKEFLEYYAELNIPYRYPIEGVSVKEKEQEKYKEKEQKQDQVKSMGDSGFSLFWQAYPKKIGKGAAEQSWEKKHPPIEQVLKAVAEQRNSDQWTKDGGQYIPNPATWLNQQRWLDEVSNGSSNGNSAGQRATPAATGIYGAGSPDWEAEKQRAASRRDRIAEAGGNAGEAISTTSTEEGP